MHATVTAAIAPMVAAIKEAIAVSAAADERSTGEDYTLTMPARISSHGPTSGCCCDRTGRLSTNWSSTFRGLARKVDPLEIKSAVPPQKASVVVAVVRHRVLNTGHEFGSKPVPVHVPPDPQPGEEQHPWERLCRGASQNAERF